MGVSQSEPSREGREGRGCSRQSNRKTKELGERMKTSVKLGEEENNKEQYMAR